MLHNRFVTLTLVKLERLNKGGKKELNERLTSNRRVGSIPSVYRTPSKNYSEGGVRYQNFDTIKLNTCGNCIIMLNVLEK